MSFVHGILLASLALLAASWAALTWYLLAIQRKRGTARRLVDELVGTLGTSDVRARPLPARVDHVRGLLQRASREMLMYAAADRATSEDTFDVLAFFMVEQWAGRLEEDAATHLNARTKWRRITACRILYRLNHRSTHDLLAKAVNEADADVADACFSLLGRSLDPRAMDILFGALAQQKHPASLIASYIEHSPQRVADRVRALLTNDDAVLRYWGATLFARYPDEAIETELARLTDDQDARVRKAALQTLGQIGDTLAVECATRRLADDTAFVRAHAARALGELGAIEHSEAVATLLGDRDWWTRLAAREALEAMGADVWPVLMRAVGSDDGFVRNGAAEVMQNIGVLDSLIVMEAASDNPAPAKIALLKRITAAGGVRFTESLVERAGPQVGRRIRALLSTIGLERVEAM